jgi:UDP-3-O-[3-hydroxymyristoyl] glucosamine N-acyltransferase
MDIKVLTTAPVVEIDGIKYHHHPNGGGMVAEHAQVADTVYVGPFAKICGKCKLSGEAFIFGNAWIFDKAEVSGRAEVFGNAKVFGKAKVTGDAKVYGFSSVYGDAVVSGTAEVCEKAEVGGNTHLINARIGGESKVLGETLADRKVA